MNFQITKTDYLSFRFCRKDLWLQKNKPDEFKRLPPSAFQLEIIKEGTEVDKEAHNLFEKGIDISGSQDEAVAETNFHLNDEKKPEILFQAAIRVENYYIRTDILKWNKKLNGYELYEVKATTKIKREKFNNHVYDLAFQYNVCKLFGLKIVKIGVIYLNSKYKKSGEINYHDLLKTEDITNEIEEISDLVKEEMKLMNDYLKGPEERYCQCRYRTRNDNNHCSTFNYSNPDVPDYAIHDISRISAKKLSYLVEENILNIKDVPENLKLSNNQELQVQSAQLNKPIINKEEIYEFLSQIRYPIYFLDYESYLPAIPWFNNYGPYQNIVFQYSLHILEKEMPNGANLDWLNENIKHTEFLHQNNSDPSQDITNSLERDILRNDGSVIVWHQPFEKGRNKELGVLQPLKKQFMEEINDRIIDLKEVFSKSMYVDPKFRGSASIKKVLPVLAPDLSYKNLVINNGADANKIWGKMIKKELSEDEIKDTVKNLLIYCKQDTFAMVRIWQVLKNLFDD